MTQSVARGAAIVVFFAACTAVVTWPQARVLGSLAVQHQDVYFNMWRMAWFAHQIVRSPLYIFDANIFSPELRTLTLSDAMLVEGAIASPMLWAGMRPLLVHNLMLFGAMAWSGVAAFALARHLTRSAGAGVIAGIVFALAPYRFEHVMHMELQWVMWAPLAFLALHRTLETGRWRWALATGACVVLQMLSSIYYGVYLATLLGVSACLLLLHDRGVPLFRALKPLIGGALLAAGVCGAYAVPYLRTKAATGERSMYEVSGFSAQPSSYTVAPPESWLYGEMHRSRGGPERRLFPGALVLVLALIGLLLRAPSRKQIIYLIALVLAFEMSLGPHGLVYPVLYEHLAPYRGLRAAARLGIFVVLFLGILAGYGYTALVQASRPRIRCAVLAVLAAGLLMEYRVHLSLTDTYPNTAPAVYKFLAAQPRGIVAEIPFPSADGLPGPDPYYSYASTFHWFPLVNGYSGMYPVSYLQRLPRMRSFPDATSIQQLRQDNVRYVIVHHVTAEYTSIVNEAVASGQFLELGSFMESTDEGMRPVTALRLK